MNDNEIDYKNSQIEEYISKLATNHLKKLRKEKEKFIINCLIELGYKRKPNNVKAINKFIKRKKIKISIVQYSMDPFREKVVIECSKYNYIKEYLI